MRGICDHSCADGSFSLLPHIEGHVTKVGSVMTGQDRCVSFSLFVRTSFNFDKDTIPKWSNATILLSVCLSVTAL